MVRVLSVILLGFALQGCAGGIGMMLAATGTGIAAGAGVDHTLNGIAYKTFSVSQNELRFATLKTLHRMDMKVVKDADAEDNKNREIVAEALEREIEIELEPLTRRTTRMRVVANKGEIFFKDAATATEIIVQTANTLDRQVVRRPPQRAAR